MPRTSPPPIDPAELREQIRIYQARLYQARYRREHYTPTSTRRGHRRGSRCPERLGELLLELARRLATRPNFREYSYRDDMISAACVAMLRAAAVFDLTRTTAGRPASVFAYMTQTAWYAFIGVIRREHKRGLRCPESVRPEMMSLPTLLLGTFDAQSLAEALSARDWGYPPPAA